ncbi:MAG: HAD-IIB family hydrolase [Spirochaetes bacterium]|nr:MAG: HAD-IIB family hydrolase [Spirochaetota bacterium]
MTKKPAEIIFTDLDGTLLDHATYSYERALPGLDLVRALRIPLVMVSSKTFPEMAALHAELSLHSPFIFENGGGIAWVEPSGDEEFSVEILGIPFEEIRAAVPAVEEALGFAITPIGDLDDGELAARTGLTPERVRLAKMRRASMPFIVPDAAARIDLESASARVARLGLVVTRGGRFYHLIGKGADKGEAVRRVIGYYLRTWGWDSLESGGIGDSENDVPLLRAVTMPVLVRRHDGSYIDCGFEVIKTAEAGPAGFSEAVTLLCGEE